MYFWEENLLKLNTMKHVSLTLILSIGLLFFASCSNNTEETSNRKKTKNSLSTTDKPNTLKPESPQNLIEGNSTNSEKKGFCRNSKKIQCILKE